MNTSNHNGKDLPETTPGAAAGTGAGSPDNSQPSDSGNNKPVRLVTRATALRGLNITPRRTAHSTIRRNTETDLHEKDPEVPYYKTEKAIRDLICSLLERQDRMNEVILTRVIDLQYRMDDLEDELLQEPEESEKTGAKV